MVHASNNKPGKERNTDRWKNTLLGFIPELDRFLRVVVLEDGETIHNAFIDRNFKLK